MDGRRFEDLGFLNRDCLEPSELPLYDAIRSIAESGGDTGEIPAGTDLSAMDLIGAVTAVIGDLPRLDNFGYTVFSAGGKQYIRLDFRHNSSERRERDMLLDRQVERIAGLCLGSCTTDYEKELFIHDHLSNTVEYLSEEDDESRFTAYGAIVEHKAVCQGIALAASVLLNRVGIGCGCVSNGEHMWNIVRIGGELYHADMTWDLKGEYPVHDYFNVSDRDLIRDRECLRGPVCTSESMNWFVVNGADLRNDPELASFLYEALVEERPAVHFRYRGSSAEKVLDVLGGVMKALGVHPKTVPYFNESQSAYHLMFSYL